MLCDCGEQCGQRTNSDPDSVDLVQRGNLSAADLCACVQYKYFVISKSALELDWINVQK